VLECWRIPNRHLEEIIPEVAVDTGAKERIFLRAS
jgi:hypothetical protein